ncbi:hypothetical protein CEXT_295911 [Caerostris extrusa]|uniref:Uncharacterized protein n=1 Tax=Caerostris extrusa TaxID=172846 RepID=A0AAV4UP63_CAEEX|nr:hypothetical protein CEXT_295911 [Caerostris extrusa]
MNYNENPLLTLINKNICIENTYKKKTYKTFKLLTTTESPLQLSAAQRAWGVFPPIETQQLNATFPNVDCFAESTDLKSTMKITASEMRNKKKAIPQNCK